MIQETIFNINDEESVGKRIDIYLSEKLSMSRNYIQNLIADNAVLVRGKIAKANYRLRLSDDIIITIPEADELAAVPENIPLDILYEDKYVLVVNKPRGMVVHPAPGNYSGTLVNAILYYCPDDLSGINGVLRPGIVHRLDKDTSGVMIVAKNEVAHLSLAKQIQTKEAERLYLAIVHGNVKQDSGIIDLPIGRDEKDRKKMAVTYQNSRSAITHYRVLERLRNFTLVVCKLMTGRTHQIRVHMAHLGHPLANDEKYSGRKTPFSFKGQALHSACLSFAHPTTSNTLKIAAPLPIEMKKALQYLRHLK